MTPASALFLMLPQWVGTAGAFWLVWWAAQTRDGAALRGLALALAILPAVLSPLLIVVIQMRQMPVSSIGTVYAASGFVVEASRCLFLGIWAAISKDRPGLRTGGGVIAGLILLYLIGVALAAMAMGIRV